MRLPTKAFFSLAALALFAGCVLEGNGHIVTEDRETAEFSAIEIEDGLPATVQIGATAVRVSMDDNLVAHIRTWVDGDTLIVDVDEDFDRVDPSSGSRILVRSPFVRAVRASAGSDVTAEANADEVELDASAGSDLEAQVSAEDVSIAASGGSDVTLGGAASTIDVVASGGSDVESVVDATSARIDASGASDVTAHATERVRIRASGASSVVVIGDPAERDVELSGESDVHYRTPSAP